MENEYDFLYDFSLTDLIEYLDDTDLTNGEDRLTLLEIAIEQIKGD